MNNSSDLNPLISVIVTVYNLEKYIDECLESICRQSYKNLQILVIDDGSTDGSSAICEEWAKKDNRIQVFHQMNQGAGAAKNRGLELARGDLIGFVDGDDFIEKTMYEDLLHGILDYAAEISMCGRWRVDVNGTVLQQLYTDNGFMILSAEETLEHLLRQNDCDTSTCDKLFKKELWEGLRFPEDTLLDDLLLTVKLISKADHMVHIGKPEYHYRAREGSIGTTVFSEQKFSLHTESLKVYKFIEKNYPALIEEAGLFLFNCMSDLVHFAFFSKTDIVLMRKLIAAVDQCRGKWRGCSLIPRIRKCKFWFKVIVIRIRLMFASAIHLFGSGS